MIKNIIKKTWNVINSSFNSKSFLKKRTIESLTCEGTSYDHDEDIANKLNYYCFEIGENFSNSFDNVTENSRSATSVSKSLFYRNVSKVEVERNVNGMKNKSGGISTYP